MAKFYNTNLNDIRSEKRDKNGLFTARDQAPKVSGITTPVTFTSLKKYE